MHKNKEKEERAILDFYNEHDQFALLFIYEDTEGQLNVAFEFPRCYELGCNHRYKDEELEAIAARLRASNNFTKELTAIKDIKQSIDSILGSDPNGKTIVRPKEEKDFNNHLYDMTFATELVKRNQDFTAVNNNKNVKEADTMMHKLPEDKLIEFRKDLKELVNELNAIQIIGFSYLHKLLNGYKDAPEVLKRAEENFNKKFKKKYDIQQFPSKIGKSDTELKNVVLIDTDFSMMLYTFFGLPVDKQKLSVKDIKAHLQGFSNELRVAISIKPLDSNNETAEAIYLPEELKDNTFPNLTNTQINIQLLYDGSSNQIYTVFENDDLIGRARCNHLINGTGKDVARFNKSESLSKYLFCLRCKRQVSKKSVLEENRGLCMICMENFALNDSVVSLKCGQKICNDCYKDYEGKAADSSVYCKVCGRLRMILFSFIIETILGERIALMTPGPY